MKPSGVSIVLRVLQDFSTQWLGPEGWVDRRREAQEYPTLREAETAAEQHGGTAFPHEWKEESNFQNRPRPQPTHESKPITPHDRKLFGYSDYD